MEKTREQKQQAEVQLSECQQKCITIEKEIQEFSSGRESKLKSLENKIKILKKEIQKESTPVVVLERECEIAREDHTQAHADISKCQESEKASFASIANLKDDLRNQESDIESAKVCFSMDALVRACFNQCFKGQTKRCRTEIECGAGKVFRVPFGDGAGRKAVERQAKADFR
jgi:predicted  nucleic acid-binding Zn-ribbon protein